MTVTSTRRRSTTTALGSVAFGGAVYGLFFLALLYFIGFVADVLVPRSVDDGGPEASALAAASADVLLILVFTVPHSLMARPAVKSAITRVVPPHLERSVYVLVATAALGLLFSLWGPIPVVVWDVAGIAGGLLWATYLLGWLVVVLSTFLINHFDLFGLRQVYLRARGVGYEPVGFRTPFLYRIVRHPMMLGFFLVLWGAPVMTVGHLLFALLFSGYILVGVRLEERDLRTSLPGYGEYARRVPRLVPRVRAPR